MESKGRSIVSSIAGNVAGLIERGGVTFKGDDEIEDGLGDSSEGDTNEVCILPKV